MFVCRNKDYFLSAIFSGITIHLFKNDFTPDSNTLTADYEEVNVKGYSPIYITYNDLIFERSSIYIRKEFPINRQAIVYGYYLDAGGNLLGGERFKKAPYKIYITGVIKLNIKVNINIK